WGACSSTSDGLNSVCRWCNRQPEKRRPRQLRTCPDCPDQTPRELRHFGKVLHDDGTQSYSEFCRLHHMMGGGLKRCRPCGTWKPAAAYYEHAGSPDGDRKSTRLNSSHVKISYAVFCLKKK